MALKIVTATHLDSWANSLAAREDLPEIVKSLIRASCPSLQSIRFPSEDTSQVHGFDGVAESLEGNQFVPEGRSIWEFGAGKNFKTKANEDYEKRKKEVPEPKRSTQTFTFVTPRIWDTGLVNWEEERANDGWLKVRVVDAVVLEDWLAEYPAVALPLARKLQIIPPSGIRTVPEVWEEYSLAFDPPLREQLLLNGRLEQARRLCEALSAGLPSLSKWQAGSPEEAAGFIAAAIMSADAKTSSFLCAKTLVLDTIEAARTVPTNNGLNFILPPSISHFGAALARRNQVILALGDEDRGGQAEVLERMNTLDFAAGLRSMGIEDGEAFRMAGICGRSLTVLSRLRASAIAKRPKWHDDHKLVPFVLAGGWNASNEHDCAIMAKLCNSPYEDVDSEARRFSSLADAPLDLQDSIWTLRSPMDAFTLLGQLIDVGNQRRFHEVCVEVFSEQARTLDIAENERPIVPTRGADFRHSEWLRRGLARTLLMISGLHEAAKFRVIGFTAQQYVDDIVGSIPRIAEDIRVVASLKSEFPSLVEAAPFPLASALEQVLEGDSEKWARVVFRDKDEGLFGSSSPHTYLLWGFETMAWNPEYLHRAASMLMTLAEVDPGGRLSNRPLESLREIFLAWRPSTYARLEERIAVLRSVCRKHPKVGLKLAMSLLPSSHDFSHGTAKPRLKDFGEAQSKPITPTDVNYAFQQYAALAVELAGTDASQLMTLIDSLPQLEPSTRSQAMLAIRTSAKNASSDTAFQLWSKLRDLVQKHRNFREAAWALPDSQLKPLEQLCQEIEPADPVKQIVWLFNEHAPTAGSPKGQDYLAEANRARAEALATLLGKHGLAAVLDLAKTAKLPHFVGVAIVESGASLSVLREALSSAIAEQSDSSLDFAIAISAAAHFTHGPGWDSWIGPFAKGLTPSIGASLFLRWPDNGRTWGFVAALSPEIDDEYWRRKWPFRASSPEDLGFEFDKYVHVGRFSAIVHMVSYSEHILPTAQCVQVLQGLIGELNSQGCRLQDVQHEVVHMIQALQERQDVNFEALAAIEYQFLPLLEFHAEPKALNRLLGTSPDLFMSVVRDAFSPASGEKEEITEDRRLRARLAYQLLRSIKTVPGFSAGAEDLKQLRSWISDVRKLAKDADRAVITDQQIGQILAFAPFDKEDQAWPAKPIRDLIEELAADEVELGIAISRFNQRGSFTKELYDGGKQERALATQYRTWADAARNWPRTTALLRRIADDWERQSERADSEALLDQLRHGQ